MAKSICDNRRYIEAATRHPDFVAAVKGNPLAQLPGRDNDCLPPDCRDVDMATGLYNTKYVPAALASCAKKYQVVFQNANSPRFYQALEVSQ